MCLTWHSYHELLAQCLDSFSLGSAFLHRVWLAGGLPPPRDKWAHWQLTEPHPWLLKTPEPSPFTSPPFPKESAWPSAQWKISKRRKRQNKRSFSERICNLATLLLLPLCFFLSFPPFCRTECCWINNKDISQRSSLQVISSTSAKGTALAKDVEKLHKSVT